MIHKKIKASFANWKISNALITLSIIAVFFGLVGLYTIYVNNKTDGLNNGQITVTNCVEKDWAWKVYSCTGNYFSTGGGMVERDNVTVKVTGGELKQGDIVDDVYAPQGSNNQTTSYFVTGHERASVTYNVPSLISVFIAILLPVIAATYILATKTKK